MIRPLAAILLLVFCSNAALAVTLFVDQANGDDMNDGLTEQTAVQTVTEALARAVDDDRVVVGPGTYSATNGEVLPLSFAGSITIQGAGRYRTFFDGEGQAQVVSISQLQTATTRLESLAIVNGNSAIGAGLFVGQPGNLELEDVHFEGNEGSIGGALHVQINQDQDPVVAVENCSFVDNSAAIGPGVHIQQNGLGQHSVTISRSLFRGHSNDAIAVSQNDGASVLSVRSTIVEAGAESAISAPQSVLEVINSTLVGSTDLVFAGNGLSVINSILLSRSQDQNKNAKGSPIVRGSGGTLRDSIVSPLAVDGHTVGANVLDVDPLLTLDQRLTASSPARDRGDNALVISGELDIDGEPRIQSDGSGEATVDLGADEADPQFRTGQDEFEPNDTPLTPTEYPRFFASVGQTPQAHTLTTDDEDWLYWELASNTPCSSTDFPFRVTVRSGLGDFRPIIETYPAERVVDPTVLPTQILGSCDTPTPSGTVFEFPIEPLVRVRNCPSSPHVGIYAYEFEPVPDLAFVCSPLAVVQGQVLEAGSGAPVPGLFILSSDNVVTVSRPGDASYSIVVLDTSQASDVVEDFSLQVIADNLLSGGQVTIDRIVGQSTVIQNLVINRQVFADGFED